MYGNEKTQAYMKTQAEICESSNQIDKDLYAKYGVKKGLRDINGKGVLTGLTNIANVVGSKEVEGEKIPCKGELWYRGYNLKDLVSANIKDRFGFEEVAYLLLFGELPTQMQLDDFKEVLVECRSLPSNFTRDVIMKAPSVDIMNSMTKSVLTLASYDPLANDVSIDNVLRQSIQLISIFPMLAVYAYHAFNHYEKDESMYIHRPDPELSTSENFLRLLRPDMSFTELEAKVLDVILILHMEHGGGNNSTFTIRTVTSTGSDTYASVAAALSSLKGPKHGGANRKVMEMMNDIREHVKDYGDEDEVRFYLDRILNKQTFDEKGLIYGMGHAVYSLSDPRAEVLSQFVDPLAKAKGREDDLKLYRNIEKIAPELIAKERKIFKGVSPNVDFFSGFVYEMMGIPMELYTPLFAIARIAGWSAHRLEELITTEKIIRPAYKSLVAERSFIRREDRK